MILDGGRPGDRRGFVHRKILGGISKIAGVLPIPAAGTIAQVAGILAGGGKEQGKDLKFGGGIVVPAEFQFDDECPGSLVMASDGHCVAPGSGHFRKHFGGAEGVSVVPVGEAVMGRYGAALRPGSMLIDRAVCLRGMQLADDGLCYNKSQISNKQRKWPAGRKPLLSGGDMRAIGIAARAGARLAKTTSRLRSLGMMKALPKPRARPHQHAKQATAVVSV